MRIYKRAPYIPIYSLLLIFFFELMKENVVQLKRFWIFMKGRQESGQAINFQKPGIFFRYNVATEVRVMISNSLGVSNP